MHHALSRKSSLRTVVPPEKSSTPKTPLVESNRSLRTSRRSEKSFTSANKHVENNTNQALVQDKRDPQKRVNYSPDENKKLEEYRKREPSSEKRTRTRTTSTSGLKLKNRSEETQYHCSEYSKLEQESTGLGFHTADQGVRIQSASSYQDTGKPLQRRVSWGRRKIHELPEQETECKRASALGLPCLEKELLPSLRDTVDKMTNDNNLPMRLNQTNVFKPSQDQGRSAIVSEMSQKAISRPAETRSIIRHDLKKYKGRHYVPNEMNFSSKSGDEADAEPQSKYNQFAKKMRPGLRSLGASYSRHRQHEYTTEADVEDSESSLSTPRLFSISRAVSPHIDHSTPTGASPSYIPSPRLGENRSSPNMRAKSPRIVQDDKTSGHYTPGQHSRSHTSRGIHLSDKLSHSTKLPIVNYSESGDTCKRSKSREGTPRLGKLNSQRQNGGYFDDSKSGEQSKAGQSVGRVSAQSSPFQPSPRQDESSRRPHYNTNVSSRVYDSQATRDFSRDNIKRLESDVVVGVQASDDSRIRRKNELADLVDGLGLDPRVANDDRPKNQGTKLKETTSSETGFASTRYLLATPKSRHNDPGLDVKDEKLLRPDNHATDFNRDSILMLNAERQKEAFGIPPSKSNLSEDAGSLSLVESSTSIKNMLFESEYEENTGDLELSMGAERLFQTLAIGADPPQTERIHMKKKRVSWRSSMIEAERYLSESMPPVITPSSSSSSVYNEDVPERPWQKRDQDTERLQNINGNYLKSSWKKTLPSSAYMSLKERYGEQEMLRQEVIWDLCETENTFCKSLRTALKVYVHPLLGKNRTWVSGLPSNFTQLMDWLDDIYQLHAQINSSLRHARSKQYPVILRIAETLRPFVPRLEVYQPFIVRLDEIVDEISSIIEDPQNDLGEFFRIQSVNNECNGLSLCSTLWLPLTRLGKFLKYFNELWLLTPRTHVDHLPAFSLLHSTTMVIRVMREVKIREEEYIFVKDLISRIHGLPESVHIQLGQRERKLIAHGPIQRLHFSEHLKRSLNEGPDRFLQASQEKNRQCSRTETSRRMTIRKATSLDSLLSDAPSMTSLSSAASNYSLDGDATLKSYDIHFKGSRFSGNSYVGHERAKSSHLHAFIFNDLAIFTSPTFNKQDATMSGSQGNWEILEDIGICRVLSLSDHSGKLGYDHLIGVHVLPLDIEHLDKGVPPDTTVSSLYLHLPEKFTQISKLNESRKRWRSAFEQCCNYTLHSLSFPAHSGHYLTQGPAFEAEDSATQGIISILASGLPLPKSPSLQMIENRGGEVKDNTLKEREERGWWVLRFQQTLKEMQRNSLYLNLVPKPLPTRIIPTSRKTVSSRRRLKLGGDTK